MPTSTPERTSTLAGYGFALTAGALWGTTGPLSTALYDQGVEVTGVGFWRVLLATAGFILYGALRHRGLFRVDRAGLLLVAGGGGLIVAVFEVAYQFAIAGIGVAGAATLLYLAPMLVAVLARPLLGEALTLTRLLLAGVVLVGVGLTVTGHAGGDALPRIFGAAWAIGVAGGLLSAVAYAGSTLLARWAVPRYGSVRTLFLELLGGTVVLAVTLPLMGHPPGPPTSAAGWTLVVGLGLGSVFAANLFFFAAVKRIEAAPTAIAASIEPVVGALLALALFGQQLTLAGWLGLVLVVAGVATSYARERTPA